PAPFFRFPYLSDTPRLRQHLSARGVVVIDVDVDSKDYFVSSHDQVRQRTLAALERRGSGIILLHDLHQRTVDMLPKLLDDLHARGYKAVDLQPAQSPADQTLASLVKWSTLARQALGSEFIEICLPALLLLVAARVEVIPGEDACVVAVIEQDTHGIIAD